MREMFSKNFIETINMKIIIKLCIALSVKATFFYVFYILIFFLSLYQKLFSHFLFFIPSSSIMDGKLGKILIELNCKGVVRGRKMEVVKCAAVVVVVTTTTN